MFELDEVREPDPEVSMHFLIMNTTSSLIDSEKVTEVMQLADQQLELLRKTFNFASVGFDVDERLRQEDEQAAAAGEARDSGSETTESYSD